MGQRGSRRTPSNGHFFSLKRCINDPLERPRALVGCDSLRASARSRCSFASSAYIAVRETQCVSRHHETAVPFRTISPHERPAPFSPTPARVDCHCHRVDRVCALRSEVELSLFLSTDVTTTPRRASPPQGGDSRGSRYTRTALRSRFHRSLRGTHCVRPSPRSRLTPFASWRSRCSRHASLAPSRCASSQVWLRLRPSRAFAFQPVVPLRSLTHLLVTSSACPRARDSRPGHGPTERAGPRTTLPLAAQVPAHGARGWFVHL